MKKIKVMVIVTLIIGAIVYPVINDEKINASSSDGWHEMVGGITIGLVTLVVRNKKQVK